MSTFEPDDKVICVYPRGYNFTEGKEYTVVDYIPEDSTSCEWFTWPPYLKMIDDSGREVICHTHRFIPKS